jgi:hypothetical protein
MPYGETPLKPIGCRVIIRESAGNRPIPPDMFVIASTTMKYAYSDFAINQPEKS